MRFGTASAPCTVVTPKARATRAAAAPTGALGVYGEILAAQKAVRAVGIQEVVESGEVLGAESGGGDAADAPQAAVGVAADRLAALTFDVDGDGALVLDGEAGGCQHRAPVRATVRNVLVVEAVGRGVGALFGALPVLRGAGRQEAGEVCELDDGEQPAGGEQFADAPEGAVGVGHVVHRGRGPHRPYCHGWEVRDKSIGILATSPASIHHAWLFRQLADDLIYFTRSTELDAETRARFAARNIRIIETDVKEVVSEEGALAGVRLTDGTFVGRRVLAVATQMQARTEGLEGLKLPMEDLPDNMGRRFASSMAGTTEVAGVWVAGNATDLTAQVGASAAAGALAGSHINALLATADTDAALAAGQKTTG
ncbi:oxidoreductase [Streptomyces violaceusniger]|uniref:Oxidoreductase n=1 Tax=Streptomyces violaceusniger TaxID=68280 RepID=A0A4D4LMV1_STRVO|nr:oxidoreductase [Streptomyces violaceusniger]